ncbi:hypothetical protein VSU19_14770 [Verrucomicrobiales bacterium BCK34]|nr:hypothetical protein [Verrucomicrobiales bacterium BCK34]
MATDVDAKPKRRVSVAMRLILITAAILTLIITCLSIPVSSIEGIWRSPSLISCMCDAYSFWELKDGVITYYSDKHNSGYQIGEYSQQEDGRFKLTIRLEGEPDWEMIVTPRALHFDAPEDVFFGKPTTWFARLFYRPLSRGRADQVIADTIAAGPDTGPEPFP